LIRGSFNPKEVDLREVEFNGQEERRRMAVEGELEQGLRQAWPLSEIGVPRSVSSMEADK